MLDATDVVMVCANDGDDDAADDEEFFAFVFGDEESFVFADDGRAGILMDVRCRSGMAFWINAHAA